MYPSDILRNCGLKYREKFGNSCYRQLLRMAGMLLYSPFASFRQGILKAMVGLTYDCQCRCSYCCSGLYPRNRENELSEQEVKGLLNSIAELPSVFTLVSFFGGEAMLKESLFSLIEYACGKGLFTETETNGLLLSRQRIKNLKKAGLHHIFIKIESTDPALHDEISGVENCFKSAIEGIRCCVAEKLSCSISTIAFKDKIYNGELKKIISMGKCMGVSSIRILYPTAAGKLSGAYNQLLNQEDKNKVRSLLRPDFVYLESTHVCIKELDRTCPSAQKNFFYVSCYGQVQPCPFVPLIFGNIRDKKIGKILKHMWQQPFFNNKRHNGCLMDRQVSYNRYINQTV